MSLKQFLAVGHSFFGMADGKSPYELREENRLPKFQAAPRFIRNPEGSRSHPFVQRDWVEETQGTPKRSAPAGLPFNMAPARPLSPVAPLAPVAPAEASSGQLRPQPFAAPGEAVQESAGWLTRIFNRILRGRKQTRNLVQGELQLDQIRVVRNDLADSDLELVVRKKKVVLDENSARPAEYIAGTEHGWGRLAARLFEVNQMR